MDPNIISNITELSKTVSKCYTIFSEATLSSKHERNLYYKLRIEEARFILWCRSCSSTCPGPFQRLEGKLNGSTGITEIIRNILAHIIDTFMGVEKRFGFATEAPGLDQNSPGFNLTSFQNLDPLVNPRKIAPKINDSEFKQSVSHIMDSQWSINDKSTFMLFIREIKDFNDGIYALLPCATRETLGRALPAEILSSTEEEGKLRIIADAASEGYPRLQETASFKGTVFGKAPARAGRGANPRKTLEVKSDCISIHEYLDLSSGISSFDPINGVRDSREYLQYLDPEISYDYDDRPEDYEVPMLIEWKSCNIPVEMKPEIFSRVDSLAQLLHVMPKPADMRVLELISWFRYDEHDSFHIGFVHKPPPSPSGTIASYCSLQGLLEKLKLPPLGDRFSLAKTLARAVLQIHSVGWLHRDLRPDNIIFFSTATGFTSNNPKLYPSYWKLDSPYLSGFFYRDEWDPRLSDQRIPYNHPKHTPDTHETQALRLKHALKNPTDPIPEVLQPFKQEYDVYSLGCVLLEVGLWDRLDLMYKPGPGWSEELKERVNELGGKCGTTYQSVVEWCLMTDRKEELGDGEALREFVWEVVDKLENLRA